MKIQTVPNARPTTPAEANRVLDAKYLVIDAVLYVRFADGLERAVRWADLPFARRLSFDPVAAVAGTGGETISMVNEAGHEIDVAAASLRAALDSEYRERTQAADAVERRIIGERIRGARERVSLTQQELARRSGISQESLSRIETGLRDPRVSTLRALARGMDLTLDQLLERLSTGTG
jgi:DNA-binding XRE family transcriptional regulator